MAIKEELVKKPDKQIQSGDGSLSFRQGSNKFIIQSNQKIFVEISDSGFSYYDKDGRCRIILGKHPKTGEVGLWISKPSVDVSEELKK